MDGCSGRRGKRDGGGECVCIAFLHTGSTTTEGRKGDNREGGLNLAMQELSVQLVCYLPPPSILKV